MLGKRKIRKFTFELVFGYEFNKDESPFEYYERAYDNFICQDDENESVKGQFIGICENIINIDTVISNNLSGWKISRLSKATLSIMRVSVYEMMYAKLPPAISINEAVEFAKEYGEDGASSYINGVLNNIAKSLKTDE
ncbi:MAG: transcription antitermination factor NusB [Clostridia bacterium]|nr:transcription antitermination factor NusB [Clostridia bacterium]